MTCVESNTVSLTVWPQITRVTNQPKTYCYNVCRMQKVQYAM